MRILDRLTDTPAQIMGPLGETLAQNPVAVALLGDETHFSGPARSAPYRWFIDPASRAIYPVEDHDHHSRVQVSQLRAAAARAGPRSEAAALVGHLRARSAEFAALWEIHEIGMGFSELKRFVHPEVSELSLFCQVAVDPQQLQTLLVFTATPGSASADKLQLLTVLGSSDLADR